MSSVITRKWQKRVRTRSHMAHETLMQVVPRRCQRRLQPATVTPRLNTTRHVTDSQRAARCWLECAPCHHRLRQVLYVSQPCTWNHPLKEAREALHRRGALFLFSTLTIDIYVCFSRIFSLLRHLPLVFFFVLSFPSRLVYLGLYRWYHLRWPRAKRRHGVTWSLRRMRMIPSPRDDAVRHYDVCAWSRVEGDDARRDLIIMTYAHDPNLKRWYGATWSLRRMCMIPSDNDRSYRHSGMMINWRWICTLQGSSCANRRVFQSCCSS